MSEHRLSSSVRRTARTLLMGALCLSACTKDNASSEKRIDRLIGASAGTLDLRGEAYTPGPVANAGSVVGQIKLEGATTAAIKAAAAKRSKVRSCPTDSMSAPSGSAGTLVWIAGVRSGKSLPVEKRTELASSECDLDPQMQAVVVGTTVNIVNYDRVLHRLVFTRAGTHDTLSVMPFYDAGSVVANDRLAKSPGLIEVQCAEHPQLMRAYVAVFDNPYFAVTENDGSFRIDSLPPGTYKVMAWRAGMKRPMEQQVEVRSGGAARLQMTAP